ncbi:MAG: hypothetical protein GEU75_01405 [Dehalococcoidia bacterium]|nr:hypothetical protein [Dehalococcoidia bacterium]
MEEERTFLESFEGAKGKAELWEVVGTDPSRPGLEKVEYQVLINGETHSRLTIGEASILGCELAGDPRFTSEVTTTGQSNL